MEKSLFISDLNCLIEADYTLIAPIYAVSAYIWVKSWKSI